MKKDIKSRWVVKTGQWDSKTSTYINIQKREFTRTIKMSIKDGILEFIGGPTGHERYRIKDLMHLAKSSEFCLCAGTVNSWPSCHVPKDEVVNFLKGDSK